MRRGDEFAGRYVLKEVIGAGRSGDVWLAHDKTVGQDVALKPERIEGDRETAVRRLLGEPRAMAKFRDHPHVVTLFDVVTVPQDSDGESDGRGEDTYWFIMEYVPGGGLDRQPPMSPQRAARIGAELADALTALHEAGIVHCDIKPANIGLTGRGTAKLLDFGAAHRSGGTETVTANGPSSFTPAYAAPELARGNIPRPESDVFCLGATLYALVTGSPPRGNVSDGDDEHRQEGGGDGEDTERLTHWKAERGVVEMDAEAVGPLFPVLTSMLQRDPRHRPAPAEVKRLLAAIAGPERDDDEQTLNDSDKPAGHGRRRWPLLAAALGVSAALALTLVFVPDDDGETHDTDQAGQGRLTDEASNGSGKSSGQSLIGDPHTADLCKLADPTALGRFGEAQVDVDYGNFDRCDVLLRTDEETRIDVSLDLQPGSRPESSQPATTVGKIGILEEERQDDECGLKLVPEGDSGGFLVEIRVNVGDGTVTGGRATLCGVADSAAQSAAAVLNRGPIPRRPQAYPKDSLAWSNACDLLDTKALSVVPGVKAGAPEDIDVAKWRCEWSSDDDLETEVSFFRDQPKTEADGDPIRLSGYDAIVEAEDDTCSVFVEYRPYSGTNAEPAAEMLRLRVDGQRPSGELRSMATSLARSAAAKLPPR
ncbi:serine/threonine-protein kinase [Streptomyces ureilyticus]|uniref:non-specific serine/threonine protein kinase n=1 Tax=Streptomyces ureilyticus TaxID=1775131 RepID=A0ABX0DXA3_9ACTN|nr:serine/threonine-protein kinase [Streptomyces ureilyticus]NGO45509.1 protein kinase [Streptomyces ureilyticus]